ncbi:unnamed protein product [Paramecium octaurelia]|uniref:Tetratricopeptide repeat protein n=1 Tax=Paramecium octaurelia TaxID=43137 RepID=A0A8S1WYB9_PAROT|nr:unnamed protein product [Paramecium octaurelia]
MSENNIDNIKCPISEHAYDIKLVCFNESCKANRLYCIQCIRDGIHVSHPQNQQEVPLLFEFIGKIGEECDDWITNLNQQMNVASQQFQLLIEGIRSKYQKSKQQFLNLNPKQMNSFFDETIQFQSFQYKTQDKIQQSIKEFQDQMDNLISGLKLSELNYYISNSDLKKTEELYQKGHKLYWMDDNYEEAIKLFDQALIVNSTHKLSLWCKANCLRMLGQFKEAINWADKALEVDPKHCNSLQCKGSALTQLKMFKDANQVIDLSLSINPNHFDSLWSKGCCLQQQNLFQEALIFYEKALKIIPNDKWTINRRDDCLKALNQK